MLEGKICLLFLFSGEEPGNLLENANCKTIELFEKNKRVTLYLSSRVLLDLIFQTFTMRIKRGEKKPIVDPLFNAIILMQSIASPPIHRYSNNNVCQTTIHFEPTLFFKDKCLEIKICNFDNKDFKMFNDRF